MAESSKKTEKYIPNPFEAYALMKQKENWRFYDSKEEFEKTVGKYKNNVDEKGVNAWNRVRSYTAQAFGVNPKDMSDEALDAAEQQIRNDKELWKKVQAAHLYNTAGFKPQIDLADEDEISADDILKRISENLDKIEKGKLVDGKYQPSRAEKAVLRTLDNYGEFIRNPKDEKETAKFYEEIQKRFNKISKREDYQKFAPKQQKKQSQKTERKEKTMSDENKFELSPEQLEFCTTHGIKPEDITSKKAFEAKKAEIENAENSEDKENKEKQDKENKDKTKEPSEKSEKEDENEENKKKEAINVHIGEPHAEDKTNEEVPDWVKRKAAYYQGLADKGEITDYKQDTSKQGFAAEFNNAEIHYTSETEVTVSEDAGYTVFEKMLEEKDNEGRPVEFPENASKEVATRMYAACVLHGNPMQGAVPKELDAETLAKCGLTPEQIEQVNNHLAASQQKNDGQEKSGEEKTGDEKQISAKAQEDIKKLAEIRNNFNQMKKDGLIAIQKDENGKPQIVRGEKGSEKDVAEATKIMQEATNLVKAGLETNRGESTKLETQEQKDTNESLRQQQIENVRAKMSLEQAKARQEKEDARDLVMAARLGIAPKDAKVTDRSGQEVKAKTGEDLKSYQSNLSKETMARLTQKYKGAEK